MTFQKIHLTLTSLVSLILGMILALVIVYVSHLSSQVSKLGSSFTAMNADVEVRFKLQTERLLQLRDQTEQLFDTQYTFLSSLKDLILLVPHQYRVGVLAACKRWHVPLAVLYLVTEVETGFVVAPPSPNPNGSYDRYITRINSYYERDFVAAFWDLHHRFNGNNPSDAFYLTAAILANLHSIAKTWSRAIMAYNQGPSNAILDGRQVTSSYLKTGESKLSEAVNLLTTGTN